MIIPEGFSQVNMIFTGTGLPSGAQVAFGVRNEFEKTPIAIANLVKTAWVDSVIMAFFANTTIVTGILVKNGPNDVGPAATLGVSLPGASGSAQAAPNVAVLAHKVTGIGGRHGRGRMYLPGIPEGNVSAGGALDATIQANLTTNLGTFLVKLEAADIPMTLLHSDAFTPVPVEDLIVDATVATQRRRLRR